MITTIFLFVQVLLVLVVLLTLPFQAKSVTIKAYTYGLLIASVWFFVLQQAPQINDIQPDSETYILQSSAIAKHWKGEAVNSKHYILNGLQSRGIDVWQPNGSFPIMKVLGTQHIFYPAFLAVGDYFMLSTAAKKALHIPIMAACFPMMMILFSIVFSRAGMWAWLPCVFLTLDSGFFALGNAILRDVIIAFFVLLLFVYTAAYYKLLGKKYLLGVVFVTAALMGLRYHFIVLFLLTLFIALLFLFLLPNKKDLFSKHAMIIFQFRLLWLVVAVLFGLFATDLFLQGWNALFSSLGHAADDTHMAIDASETTPSLILGVVHTFLAPYPWTIIYPGLTGKVFYELFLLGSLVFTLSLPFLFNGFKTLLKRQSILQFIFILFILLVVSAYFITFGEFSTRQRESVMPYFWVVVAIGVKAFWDKRYKTKRAKD